MCLLWSLSIWQLWEFTILFIGSLLSLLGIGNILSKSRSIANIWYHQILLNVIWINLRQSFLLNYNSKLCEFFMIYHLCILSQCLLTTFGFAQQMIFHILNEASRLVTTSSSPVFEDVPKAKEGEANEETKRSSNVRYQWDNWVIINLDSEFLFLFILIFCTSLFTVTASVP